LNAIAQATGINLTSVSFYLKTLQEMGLITRTVPATEKYPDKSKLGLYQITDNYFRFWFRFVYPNRSLLERGETTQVLDRVVGQLDQFTGAAFESICREYIWRLHSAGTLGFIPQTVGNWWDRREEIDLVAIGEDAALFGECKWASKPLGVNILDDLERKTQIVQQKHNWEHVTYALFSRAGFTTELQEQARQDGVLLFDLENLTSS
jgi:AAA+ ATPase superfamily predicted ATPase